uniref:Uncharacterized protein n=1 Tax=Siphoviridae sp. ctvGX2 TaxID=2826512 RepID=A0A8S5LYS7_9CAUD|nr:MAG TPA: hypothetical protein [Siphoviridae sp. ctvGX2]
MRTRGICSCDWIRTSNRPVIGLVVMLPICSLPVRSGKTPRISPLSPRFQFSSDGHARTGARQ